MTAEKDNKSQGRLVAACLVFVGLAVILRLPGMFTDFWMDEIWALTWARGLTSPVQIFTGIHFDTNHWLYTFFMYLYGEQASWWVYRVPALVTGVAAVPLMGLIAARHGRANAVTAMLLSTASFFMIVYSSEARGYSPAILFALLAYYALRRFQETRGVRWCSVFCVSSVLGLLSHLTFLFPYSGLVAWSCVRVARPARTRLRALGALVACHLVPCTAFLLLYFADIRHVRHGGADALPLWVVIRRAAGLFLGMPGAPAAATLALVLAAAVALYEIVRLVVDRRDEAVFYPVALFLAPAVLILMAPREFAYWLPRHFIICTPWLLLLLTRLLGRGLYNGGAGRAVAVVTIALYLAGNTMHMGSFVKHGRGRYLEAVRYMASETQEPVVRIAGDHELRNLGYPLDWRYRNI